MTETRKIAAILAADVVGFSRLTGADEDRTLARLRALRSDLIDPTIAVHHGRVVKRTGDGVLVEFRSVVDAVRCAIEVQNGMVERNAGVPADRRIEFRIGIHLGDIVEESDGDLMGDGVNIAARLEGIAKPGAICLSEDAYRQVKARLNLSVSDLGATRLKNIADPIRVYSLEVGAATPDMFGSMVQGKVAAKTIAAAVAGIKVEGKAPKFEGAEFPSYFKQKDGSTAVEIELPQNDAARVSFLTDVKNNYFSRARNKGSCEFTGSIVPTFRLFNGRLTFTFQPEKNKQPIGTVFDTGVTISDAGHGPWKLRIKIKVAPPREKRENESPEPNPKTDAAPSRPDIIDVHNGPEAPPITVEKVPGTTRLQLQVNVDSRLLVEAKLLRPPEEAVAVEFVFKYGLALIAMGLLDSVKKTTEWSTNEVECRERISKSAAGVGRVIVPLCLTLPKKLPKAA